VSEPRPQRVRVTGPPRRPGRGGPAARAREIDEQTVLGAVLMSSLLRAQLRLAALTLAPLAAFAVGVPLLFRVLPGLADVRIAGVPLSWLLLAVVVYPLLLVLGIAFVRRAERHEAEFAELLGATEDE
jgi:hypothetical protein